jgi:peptidoglycan/LPS O-acetylase OafA/YrhL
VRIAKVFKQSRCRDTSAIIHAKIAPMGTGQRFRTLDGWRGICALLVAIGHFGVDDHFRSVALIRNSFLWVDFFFVLSGFVIAHAYADRLHSARDVQFFIVRRFARLWPLHIVTLLAFLFLYLLTLRFPGLSTGFGMISVGSFLSNVFLLHDFALHDWLTWNYPSWSISAEFYTYLAFATLVVAWAIRPLPCAIASGLGFLILLLAAPRFAGSAHTYGAVRCLYGFFAGVLVWRLRTSVVVPTGWLTPLEAVLVGAIGLLIAYAGRTPYEIIVPVFFAAVVLVFSKEGGSLSKLLRSRPMSFLGDRSYSIYMVHAFIGVLFYDVITTVGSKFGVHVFNGRGISIGPYTDLLTVAYIGVVIAVSAISYRMIELPGQRLIPQLIKHRLARQLVNQALSPKPDNPRAFCASGTDYSEIPKTFWNIEEMQWLVKQLIATLKRTNREIQSQ